MKTKKLLLLIVLLTLLVPNKTYGEERNPKVYLILMNKITLEDMNSMDNVQAIIKEGSLGLMNTRGISSYTGVESFLTINASEKSYANYSIIGFEKDQRNGKIKNTSLGKIINLNKNNNYMPHIGIIGENLKRQGLNTAIYGNSNLIDETGSTAALIPMDSKGLIDYGNIDDIIIEEKKYPFHVKTDYPKLLREIKNSPGDFIVIDTGDLERIYKYNENLSEEEYKYIRGKILKDIDLFTKEFFNTIDLEDSLVIITSPNNGDDNINSSRLSPMVINGRGFRNGSLISSTTNRENIISNMDIGPTIMEFLGGTRENMAGNPIKKLEESNTLDYIIKESKQINTISKVRYKSLLYYSIISIVGLLIPLTLILSKIRISKKIKEIINLLLTLLLLVPSIFILSSLLKPINIKSYIFISLGLIFLFTIIILITRRYENQVLYISGFTIILIFLDLIFKGKISMYSVLSHDPIIGARYYGIGNEMVGLLLGSITVFSKNLIEKMNNTLIPGIIFIIALGLIGNPKIGANIGGTLTFIVAIGIYIIEFLNLRLNYQKIIMLSISMIILISLIGYIDININENTTHLGNSILLIKNKGLNHLTNIVLRKILMNIKLIGRSFWAYLLLIHMFSHLIGFNLVEKIDKDSLKVVIAGVSGGIAGFLLNDSGIILAAIAMNMITLELYINGKWKIG